MIYPCFLADGSVETPQEDDVMSQTQRALFAAPVAAALAQPAFAQGPAWPTQPIRFIGIFRPGGGTDILSRIWCNRMSEITGQSFVVENRSGSGGNVGTKAIARSTIVSKALSVPATIRSTEPAIPVILRVGIKRRP